MLCLVGFTGAQDTEAKGRAPWVGKTLSGKKCNGGQPTRGPYDYLNRPANSGTLRLIEEHHFDAGVESLRKGITTTAMGDINFVLLAFPNHHRALQSAMNFSLRHKKWPQDSKGLPAECYLQRAMQYSPRDAVPYKLYGYYMHRKGRLTTALKANEQAMNLLPKDVMLQYNTALILVDLKRYKKAVELAKPLYEAGLTLPGLKNKLVRAGVWEHSAEEVEAYRKILQAKAAASDSDTPPSDPNTPPAGNTAEAQADVEPDSTAEDSAD
tara:strand:- start:5628 stop:6431 length:804 start_codon:yes stop_codon:yes gene_type:complete